MFKEKESIKQSTSTVTQPHDKLVKRLLSNPETAKDILSLYLPPQVVALVDLNNLSLERDSFIDDEHRAFAVDLLYKTTFDGEEGYLWILLEHQRKDDPWLPVRIFKYMATIWDHIRKTGKSTHIPLIFPVILYNGDRPYSHTLTFKDMIEPEASRKLFESYFKTPFCLIDLTIIKDDVLRKQVEHHVRGAALLMTLKHIFDKNIQIIFEELLLAPFKQLDRAGSRDDLIDLIYYLLNEGRFLHKDRFQTIISQDFSEEVEGKVATIAQQLQARGFEEGLEKGREQGREQGLEQGLEKGREKEKINFAERLLSEGYDLLHITKLTQLPLDTVIAVMKKHH